jgi:hypothetical protein
MNDLKRPYDTASPNADIARQVLLDWLRDNPTAKHMNYDGHAYLPYVDLVGRADFDALASQLMEAFWELVIQGIVVPGKGPQPSEVCLPWFRLTPYGRRVLQTGVGLPHDPAGYLTRLRKQVSSPDETVMAYLAEALDTFRRASHIASMVMLGIAAERVFLLLCDSLRAALANPSEEATLARLLDRFGIKPSSTGCMPSCRGFKLADNLGFPTMPPSWSQPFTTSFGINEMTSGTRGTLLPALIAKRHSRIYRSSRASTRRQSSFVLG